MKNGNVSFFAAAIPAAAIIATWPASRAVAIPGNTSRPAPVDATLAPSDRPNADQAAQIARRYGMFLHFGINTFCDSEWTDGTIPASTYKPTAIDADQWVRSARDAGMRYVILTCKHHDGFCLWDSKYTDYSVRNSGNPTDVVAAVAKACAKYHIGLGLYYSLWDRHENLDTGDVGQDAANNAYTLNQISELMSNYGPVVELWLDGSWLKPTNRWPLTELYALVKSKQPHCQVSTNWTIGNPADTKTDYTPNKLKQGDPIRYFPSDFRLSDPYLPSTPDPKVFTHDGQSYYLPFETTITLTGKWFYNTKDTPANLRPVDSLVGAFYQATAQDNMLVIDAPPNRDGRLRDMDVDCLKQLADRLGLHPGKPFPAMPVAVSTGKPATASSVWSDPNDPATYTAAMALDGDPNTRWASARGTTKNWLEIDLQQDTKVGRVSIAEYVESAKPTRIRRFHVETSTGDTWQTVASGTTIGASKTLTFFTVTCRKIRLTIDEATDAPSIWSITAYSR